MIGKILLLENDADMESIIVSILEDEDFLILRTNFSSILIDAASFRPDLVILSPRLRSYIEITKICKDLRSIETILDVPIIFVSARTELEEFAKQCDASAYLEKPFDLNDLSNTVKDVLSI